MQRLTSAAAGSVSICNHTGEWQRPDDGWAAAEPEENLLNRLKVI